VGLTVTRVKVKEFRSYRDFVLEPDPELTVLAGPNAAGKTNLVEAIQLLTEADSFRSPSWSETVSKGAEQATLTLEAEGEGRKLDIALSISSAGRRHYVVNGKPRRTIAQVAGVVPCVVFTPDDLRIVKDSAEKRRGALDGLGSQLSPTYSRLRSEYDKVLRQRNALLRDGVSDEATLGPWSERLAAVGGALVAHRTRLFSRLSSAMGGIYEKLADDGVLEARYVPSWERDGVAVADEAGPEEAIGRHLDVKREAEASRRSTISGPHRDEITFRIGGEEARVYASQGQQRTIALAWKLAEVDVITAIASQRPVLLLDDVMSELDEKRRHALAAFVGSVAQTVMTTTNLGYFEEGLLARAKVVQLP
jgi:DNA replication and repair protein RecF